MSAAGNAGKKEPKQHFIVDSVLRGLAVVANFRLFISHLKEEIYMKYIEICPISKSKIFGFFLDYLIIYSPTKSYPKIIYKSDG